jgi:hypothetical protein
MAAPAVAPAVFMSASVPDPRRHPRYHTTADIAAIREAVVALATVVLPKGPLLFGGHPAISPLILLIAHKLSATGRVAIYQSEFFRSVVPTESLAFPSITWIAEVPGDREESLARMRRAMLNDQPIRAGVFVGGMEGVETEYALFRQTFPQLPAYAIASTGAAARILFDADLGQPPNRMLRSALENDFVYDALFRALPGVA